MFPSLKISLSNLNPNSIYNVFVRMLPLSKCRYQKEQWVHESLNNSTSSHSYIHPECPASGLFLMRNSIDFNRLKITNDPTSSRQIYLKSLHQYRPEFIIEELANINNVYTVTGRITETFPQTEFIAVTAYQNPNIIKLKIDHNPFAKGFRENAARRNSFPYNSYCLKPSRLPIINGFTDFSIKAILDS